MDPQQRLTLEHGYQSLHSAGFTRALLDGTGAGVFLGIQALEYMEIVTSSPLASSVYGLSGAAHAVASGRLSFVLGLEGPCAAYDTACSAGLVAGHA
eukprot:2021975-Prymnesium_polylepis.1